MQNVLLITADQWRGDCLGVSGHPIVKTPHLDELAQHGVRFSKHYAGAAPCAPARACLYTGLYQMNNRVCNNGSPLDHRHTTLAQEARKAGYDPTLFGYTDQAADPRLVVGNDPVLRTYEGTLPGFTTRVSLLEDAAAWLGSLKRNGYAQEKLGVPQIFFPANGVTDPPSQNPPIYSAEHTQTAFLTDEFLRWMDETTYMEQATGAGWFAHISYLCPHPPFCVPEPYNSMYSADQIPDFAGDRDWKKIAEQHPYLAYQFSGIAKKSFIPGLEGLIHDWDDTALKTIAAIYYGLITEVDSQIGRIMNALRNSGAWDNTVIAFTSDHGEMLGDHCLLGKFGFYDQSYHIPLIIREPAAIDAHGSQVTEFTESVDVLPTMLALMRQKVPPQLDGKSLLPALQNLPLSNWRTSAHWEFDFRNVETRTAEKKFGLPSQLCNLSVIRDDNFKYVHFAAMPPLLFDLKNDPQETINLAEHPLFQSVRLLLAEKLLQWRAQHLDQSLALTALTRNGVVS